MIRMIPVSSPDEEPVKPGNETVPSMLEMCVCQIDFEERSLKTRTLYHCKSNYLRNKNYVMMCKEILVRHPLTTCAKLTLKKDYLT